MHVTIKQENKEFYSGDKHDIGMIRRIVGVYKDKFSVDISAIGECEIKLTGHNSTDDIIINEIEKGIDGRVKKIRMFATCEITIEEIK